MAVRLPLAPNTRYAHVWKDGGVTVDAMRSGIDSVRRRGSRPQTICSVTSTAAEADEIPADRATDGAFRLLADRAEQVRDLARKPPAEGHWQHEQRRIGDLPPASRTPALCGSASTAARQRR
jgi:hypothetical protein